MVEGKDGCGLEPQRQLAEPPVAEDEHRLRRLAAGAALRADVIGGRKLQRPAVPEGGMVARMIVGVSAQNVEYDARVKFGERRCGIDEPVKYHGRAILIARIELGRASCRERVCRYVSISGVVVALKKKKKTYNKR